MNRLETLQALVYRLVVTSVKMIIREQDIRGIICREKESKRPAFF